MTEQPQSPRLELDADGVAWVTFDDPNAKVNVLSTETATRLDGLLNELLGRPPKGVVFISAKPDIFIAGADIKELEAIRDASLAHDLSRRGHAIFDKIAALSVPTVAAIDGACLGGGCELALACRYRIATDNRKTLVGLPETQLGIIPGWGGTQRLPRLIGVRAALGIIVPGKALSAGKAARVGLVDAVVAPIALRETAKKMALGELKPKRASVFWENAWPMRTLACRVARKKTLAKTRGHYPAPLAAIDAVEQGVAKSLDEGLHIEARLFGSVATTPQCKNLIRVFFLREKYSKLKLTGAPPVKKKFEKAGVLGAGVMGAGIAQWSAACGLIVRLKDIKPEFVANGVRRIAAAFREGVERRKISELDAQHGLERVHPTTEYTGFGDCDIVVEAVLEKIEVKRPVLQELVPLLKSDCVIASNTSAIPIDDLAEATGRPEWFVGIHFFNPVHKMPLIEVVRGSKTAPGVVAAAVEFAKQLKKIVVVVNSAPGFVANRLLMPYLNEAGVLLSEGVSIQAIDDAMLAFGWPMGPLRLIDEIGIDVTMDVANELAAAFKGRMSVASTFQQVHAAGLKGRKGGKGFYVYKGRRREFVNDRLKPMMGDQKKEMSAESIQQRLMNVMLAEARLCMSEGVVEREDDIDVALIFGLGFPPFRGGLVKWARDSGLWA